MKNFIKNQNGNFAVMLAMAILPVMLTIGVAVDYSNVSNKRSELQSAVDSAILAVGQDFESMTKPEIRKSLKNYLKSNLSPKEYQQISKLIIKKNKTDNSLTVTAKAKFDTNFMMLAGIKNLDYDAVSQIKTASGGAEIALVLDTTGSMNVDDKIGSLKTAATDFVNELMIKDTGGKVKISIVPFSNHVNVGMGNRNASWIDVPDDSSVTADNVCYMTRDLISQSNCTTVTNYDNEGVPYQSKQCDNVYGDPYEVCGPRTTSETWNGCVGSRQEPLNLEDKNYNKRVPGLMNVWCGTPVLSLTDNKSSVLSTISTLSIGGDTYIPSGLTWGMRVLSGKEPFTGGASKSQAKKKEIKKFVILMTDGDNTRSAQLPDNPAHWGSDTAEANLWTSQACTNIKDEGVSVYSITFGTLSDETKNLIKSCATDASQYYHAASGNDLAKAFEDISAKISALHLSM